MRNQIMLLLDAIRIFRTGFSDQKKIEIRQDKGLKNIVEKAVDSSLFYRIKFRNINFNEPFSVKDLPVTTAKEIRNVDVDDLMTCSRQTEDLTLMSTSGTSGSPLVVYASRRETQLRQLKLIRFLWEHGWRPWWRGVYLWREIPVSKKTIFQRAINNRRKYIYLSLPLEKQAARLYENKPKVLFGMTGTIAVLAQYSLDNNLPVPKVPLIVLSGQPLGKETRELISKVYDGRCVDHYGAVEIGFLGFECPFCGLNYFDEDSFIIEVLDKDLNDAKEGNVVATSLEQTIVPMIRYSIGDRVILADENHQCSKAFKHFIAIDGRVYDTITLPDGTLFTDQRTAKLRLVDGLKQYQFIYGGSDNYTCLYTAKDGCDEKKMEIDILENLPSAVSERLIVKKVKEIPVEKSGKTKVIKRIN